MINLDSIDRKLLNLLQTDFPLVSQPFAALAETVQTSEDDVILRVKRLKEQKLIRQISAIFESTALGYTSSLVAFSVPGDRVEQVAEVVSTHPGVSHNYERNHSYNLWFTLTVPPGSSPEAEVDRLADETKPLAVRMFPTKTLFKIGVAFDMTENGVSNKVAVGKEKDNAQVALDEQDIEAVRALQRDLPLEIRPFAALASRAGLREEELITRARKFLQTGAMRRYAAVLRHREAGFNANVMAAWQVSDDMIEQIGQKLASNPAVSHCYERPTYPDWPYSVFTMIHARTPEECETIVHELSDATGISDYVLLFSTREFKKSRVQYYEHGKP